jgi:hypothetical protein
MKGKMWGYGKVDFSPFWGLGMAVESALISYSRSVIGVKPVVVVIVVCLSTDEQGSFLQFFPKWDIWIFLISVQLKS